MRSIALISAAVVLVMATSVPVASSAEGPAPTLSGKMTNLKYLIGTWGCVTKIAPIGSMKAQTIPATSRYWIEPQNVIGNYYGSKPFASSGYLGWNAAKKMWWSNAADLYGSIAYETGNDSGTNVQVLSGTNWYQGSQASTARDTFTKISDTSYRDRFELIQGGKVRFQGTSTCTKTSNTAM